MFQFQNIVLPTRRSRCVCPEPCLRARSGFRAGPRRASARSFDRGSWRVRSPARSSPSAVLSCEAAEMTPSASVMAVPLGASFFWVWCTSSMRHAIAAHAADHRRQLAVEAEHQVYAQAVVRGVEQRPALLAAQFLQLRQAVGPARRAAHHGGARFRCRCGYWRRPSRAW